MFDPDRQEQAPFLTAPALLARLREVGVAHAVHEHPPVFTVAESDHVTGTIPGMHCRNLFVRDKKEKMFLITAANETKIDLKKLQDLSGCGRLSFGSPERLWQYLGVRPGSVCPFAVLNDKDRQVTNIIDQTIMGAEMINCHPMENHMTIGLAPGDLVKFLTDNGHAPQILDLGPAVPEGETP